MIVLDVDNICALKHRENMVQNPFLGRVVYSLVERIPVAKMLWKTPSFAIMLNYTRDNINNLNVQYFYNTSLHRQKVLNDFEMRFDNFDSRKFAKKNQ